MPIIEGNCQRRNICLVGLTFYTLNPGAMGDPRYLKRGEWQRYMSNLTIEFTKKDLIKDKTSIFGHELDVRIKKSKLQEYDAKDPFRLKLYYGYGFNEYDEYANMFIDSEVVEKGGAGWVTFADENSEEIKVQGVDKLSQHLKDNPDTYQELRNRFYGSDK